jgi:hypothetical protein
VRSQKLKLGISQYQTGGLGVAETGKNISGRYGRPLGETIIVRRKINRTIGIRLQFTHLGAPINQIDSLLPVSSRSGHLRNYPPMQHQSRGDTPTDRLSVVVIAIKTGAHSAAGIISQMPRPATQPRAEQAPARSSIRRHAPWL